MNEELRRKAEDVLTNLCRVYLDTERAKGFGIYCDRHHNRVVATIFDIKRTDPRSRREEFSVAMVILELDSFDSKEDKVLVKAGLKSRKDVFSGRAEGLTPGKEGVPYYESPPFDSLRAGVMLPFDHRAIEKAIGDDYESLRKNDFRNS